MSLFSCFRGVCGPQPLVPEDHCELSRDELKRLYEQSLKLNNGRLIVHGIFARANTKNNNKRVYPKSILKREVTIFEKDHILKGTALGELDHPNYSSRYFKCLNLPNISHQVLEVHWRGDLLWGSIEVLPTPSGLLLWELYAQGIKLGVSSRGWASLRADPNGKCIYVEDDFELITFDFVTEPSTRGAFLVPVMCTYPHRVPDQRHATQLAHLGMGVVSMRNITYIPPVKTLVERINQLQELHRQGQLTQPPPAGGQQLSQLRHSLDQLLLFSHYIVFGQLPYLDREEHARDFQSHLAMFATRAHLADQMHIVSRAELNAIILKEIAKEQPHDAGSGNGGHIGVSVGHHMGGDKVTPVVGMGGAGGVVAAVMPSGGIKASHGHVGMTTAGVHEQHVGSGVGGGYGTVGPVVAGELHDGQLITPAAAIAPHSAECAAGGERPSRSSRRARAHHGLHQQPGGLSGPHTEPAPSDTAFRIQPQQHGSADTHTDAQSQGVHSHGLPHGSEGLQGTGAATDLDQWQMHPGAIELTPPVSHHTDSQSDTRYQSDIQQQHSHTLTPAECNVGGGVGVGGSSRQGGSHSLAATPPLQPRMSQRSAHAHANGAVSNGHSNGHSNGAVGGNGPLQPLQPGSVSSGASVGTGVGVGHMTLAQRLSGVHQSASTDSLQHPPMDPPTFTSHTDSRHAHQHHHHQGAQTHQQTPGRQAASNASSVDPHREAQIAAEFQRIKATLSSFGGRLWSERDQYLGGSHVMLPFEAVADAPALCPLQPKGTHRPPPR